MGPKALLTRAVPAGWRRNSRVRITAETGTTAWDSPGDTTAKPSTALMTEMAGVITASP